MGKIPAFELVNSRGEKWGSTHLQGRVWIADFIFTHCAGPCPLMSATMARITRELKDTPGVQSVSFSVDPDNDTPERLSEYAAQYEADSARWQFLTGEIKSIYALAIQHFHLAAGAMLAEPPDPAHTILHSTKFVLVDAQSGIRGYYDSFDPNQIQKLIRDARRLAMESLSHAAT